jgi:hypothetical protein
MAHVLGVDGIRLTLDGRPFPLTGLSFFNALYNPAFNRGSAERLAWLQTFRDNGVNFLRVFGQCDFLPPRTYVDVGPTNSLIDDQGAVREQHVETLAALTTALDGLGMAVEVALFAHEKEPNLPLEVLERGARAVTERLVPYRNLIVQIWNEHSFEWERLYRAVREADPARLVTSSWGTSRHPGDDAQAALYDLLTPHTVRRSPGEPFWEIAPRQIAALIERWGKPVLDDEPARDGPTQFGGIEGGTRPEWHIEQIERVRAVGGYPVYHHDMFQYAADPSLTPPSGIPDPDFRPFHRQVFDHLRATRAS